MSRHRGKAPSLHQGLHTAARTLLLACLLAGCAEQEQSGEPLVQAAPQGATEIPMSHARTFSVWDRDGYRIVDLQASIISWGGAAVGPEQKARVLLVPQTIDVPALVGDLAGAVVVRTPVQRVAVNLGPLESMLRAVGAQDRLVAIGGVKSWDDELRERAMQGEIAQVGYGWHSPPVLDALIGSRPDVFLMSLGDLGHAQQYERILSLGIPVVPVFLDAEPHYMGDVDYVRLVGMLTGREQQADQFVAMVSANVEELRRKAALHPPKTVISAWYEGGESWMATIRNSENALLKDANGINVLAQADDNQLNSFQPISTEQLLQKGRDASCWILRDTHSVAYPEVSILSQFRAWQENCLFASDGMSKPEFDAFDYYETAVIRPDWVLGDLVRMLHPALRDEPFRYIHPDRKAGR